MRHHRGSGSTSAAILAALACLALADSVFAQATGPAREPKPAAATPTPAAAQPVAPPAPAAVAPAQPAAPAQPPAPPASPATQSPEPVLAPISAGFPTPVVPEAAERTAPASYPPEPLAPPEPAPAIETTAPNSGGGLTWKPGKGVELKSSDGNFSLNVRLKTQLLDELHKYAAAPNGVENTDLRNSFVVRRLRLALAGNAFSKNLKYKVELTFAPEELKREPIKDPAMGALASDRDVISQSPLLDAYFDITHLRDLNVRVGQSKVPFGRERVLSDNDMIVVDRSLEDREFNLDRDMGIDVRSNDFLGLNLLHYYIGLYLAEDKNASLSSLGTGDTGFMYLGRVELVPFGNFEEVPVDFERGAPRLSLGVAYAFLQTDGNSPYAKQSIGGKLLGPLTAPAVIDYNVHNFTADALFKVAGFSALTAFHYRKVANLPTTATIPPNGLGWVLQASYLLSDDLPLELAANFSMTRADSKQQSSIRETTEAGFGVNYYFYQQGVKLQAEYEHIWYQDKVPASPIDNRIRLLLQVLL